MAGTVECLQTRFSALSIPAHFHPLPFRIGFLPRWAREGGKMGGGEGVRGRSRTGMPLRGSGKPAKVPPRIFRHPTA